MRYAFCKLLMQYTWPQKVLYVANESILYLLYVAKESIIHLLYVARESIIHVLYVAYETINNSIICNVKLKIYEMVALLKAVSALYLASERIVRSLQKYYLQPIESIVCGNTSSKVLLQYMWPMQVAAKLKSMTANQKYFRRGNAG